MQILAEGVQGCALLLGPISFISIQFSGKIGQNKRLLPPLLGLAPSPHIWEILDPPLGHMLHRTHAFNGPRQQHTYGYRDAIFETPMKSWFGDLPGCRSDRYRTGPGDERVHHVVHGVHVDRRVVLLVDGHGHVRLGHRRAARGERRRRSVVVLKHPEQNSFKAYSHRWKANVNTMSSDVATGEIFLNCYSHWVAVKRYWWLSPNKVAQLPNELICIKHCWGVYQQNSIVNSVRVDDWAAERAIIASNVQSFSSF